MRQYTLPEGQTPPWWESTWELTKAELVRVRLGMSFSGDERNRFFLNLEGKQFKTLSGVSGADDPDDPRGFAILDFDRDGWTDIALASRSRPSFKLLRNNIGDIAPDAAGGRHHVAFRFVGGNRADQPSAMFTSRDGYGATVRFNLGARSILREHRAGEGWRTQNSSTLLIGIDDATDIEDVHVTWPTGRSQRLPRVAAGTLVTLYENPDETSDGSGHVVEPYRATIARSSAEDAEEAVASAPTRNFPLGTAPDAAYTMYTSMATWCMACKGELANLKHLRDQVAPGDLALVGVPIDAGDGPETLRQYAARNRPAYELLVDLSKPQREAYKRFVREALGREALPSTLIVRKDGTLVHADLGTPSLSELREVLDRGQARIERVRWVQRSAAPELGTPRAGNRRPILFAAVGMGLCVTAMVMVWIIRMQSHGAKQRI